eukprot:Amastigsp_a676800_18.p2 type:complete len:126 gc:universal Amastigsp_a676800_18:94-471(+)
MFERGARGACSCERAVAPRPQYRGFSRGVRRLVADVRGHHRRGRAATRGNGQLERAVRSHRRCRLASLPRFRVQNGALTRSRPLHQRGSSCREVSRRASDLCHDVRHCCWRARDRGLRCAHRFHL